LNKKEQKSNNARVFNGVLMAKKGITAVIATVLLLMMTVAAAGVSYSWIMGMQKDVQKSTEAKYANDASKTDSKLSIDSMWNQAGNIQFTIRNTGTYAFKDLTKFSFYVDGVKSPTPGSFTGMLTPGGVVTITTAEGFPTYPAAPSKTIKVVAETGTNVVYKCEVSVIGQSYC